MNFAEWVEVIGKSVDAAGIAIIVSGAVLATIDFGIHAVHGSLMRDAYRRYRLGLGRALLLGLEFLVAANIIRTVAIAPTFESVSVLAVIVLIRTFLSTALEVELEGRWPWQHLEPREPNAKPTAQQNVSKTKASESKE